MRSLTKYLLLVAMALMAGSAGAWAHGPRVGVYFGPYWGPWWGPPMIYSAPVVVERPVYADPPVVVEAAPATDHYWYFCRAANAYYPYVKECPSGWEKVAPTPSGR